MNGVSLLLELVGSLFRSDFIHARQDILITGATGCGKSYIATAIGFNACQKELKVKYQN